MEPPGQPQEVICEQCQGRYSSPEALQQHMNNCNGSGMQPDPFEIVYTDPVFDNVHQFDGYIDHENYLKEIENLANDPPNADELDKYLGRGEAFRENRDHAADSEKHYNCSHCGLGFITELKLRVHMKTHGEEEEAFASGENGENVSQPNAVATGEGTQGPEKPHVCNICGKTLKSRNGLHIHKEMHSGVKSYKCEICGESFTQHTQLTEHLSTRECHWQFQCDTCFKSFKKKSDLEDHMKSHTGEKPYVCGICGSCFTGRNSLVRHIPMHTENKPHVCNVCKKSFVHRNSLENHMKIAHKVETKHKEKKSSASDENVENVSQPNPVTTSKGTQGPGKPYVCGICGNSYSYSHTLSRHIRARHTEEKPHECTICGKCFSERFILVKHIRTHTQEKPYECKMCQTSFSQNGSLQRHVETQHKEKKASASDENGENVSQPNALATGKGTERPEKPYVCPICGRGHSQRRYLYRHIRRMHTAKKPYACTICGKGFSEKSRLTVHIRTHTKEKPYECKLCQTLFAEKGNLQRHVKNKHPLETQHKCTVCDKSFTDNQALISHMRTHDSKKPYECTVCGQRFSKSDQWVTHIQTHGQEHI